jgi:thioredoxin reductase (NADPH)
MGVKMDAIETTTVIIIGAGPTGLEMAVALKQKNIPFLIFEAGQIGHTIAWWPRNTRFFSTSERIAMPGLPLHVYDQQHPTGEQYLAYLREVVQQFDLKIHHFEKVTQIEKQEEEFVVHTESRRGRFTYRAGQVVLATGGMAAPCKLNIPGEDLPFVTHYLDDPHLYFQRELLVVGGRNSAVEYALRCWRAGALVTLSYRKPLIKPKTVKPALMQDFETVVREGKIRFMPATIPIEITPQHVVLSGTDAEGLPVKGKKQIIRPDAVLLCTGYVADMRLFKQAGVVLEGAEQAPWFNENTMETNVAGLYVLGTAAGGTQKKYEHFIETSHKHVPKILNAIEKRIEN